MFFSDRLLFDELGQLERENNLDTNETIKYTYDNGGNIDKKEYYTYTTGSLTTPTKTVDYSYDSTWKDKLTSYNGQNIFYDAIGNPVTYRDGMSFEWQGRQMTSANLNGTAVTYTYDADGLRTTKQVGSTLYEYEYVGGQLVYEKRGDIRFYYRYDSLGQLASIKRINAAGTTYTVYAVTNSRGDIEELRHLNGSLIARYTYDTWGNTLSIVDANGNEITSSTALPVQNPFRYRGYYYDSESGLYYLQSRYYDPVTCRFVNADSLVDTSDVLGFNMYAYCGNNPVVRKDPSGNFGIGTVIGAAIGGVIGGLMGALTAKCKGKSVCAGFVTGAVVGAITGAITGSVADAVTTGGLSVLAGAAISAGTCGLVSAAGNAFNQLCNYYNEKKTKNSDNTYNSTTAAKPSNSKKSSKHDNFFDYVDVKSIAISGISAAVFAPIGLGANCIVNSAFVGFETGTINVVGQVIANFAMGGNVAILQGVVDLF